MEGEGEPPAFFAFSVSPVLEEPITGQNHFPACTTLLSNIREELVPISSMATTSLSAPEVKKIRTVWLL